MGTVSGFGAWGVEVRVFGFTCRLIPLFLAMFLAWHSNTTSWVPSNGSTAYALKLGSATVDSNKLKHGWAIRVYIGLIGTLGCRIH